VLVAVTVGAAAVSAWAVTFPNRSSPGGSVSGSVLLFAVVFLGYWCGMVGEPAYRLWRVSRRRPAVQRARLRALAVGYSMIIAVFILLLASVGAAAASQTGTGDGQISPVVGVLFEVLFIAAAPALYVSFRPPGWLRRSWRIREEEGYLAATRDLLLSSPDRTTMAERAVDWAPRLVGADGAAIIEGDGSVLASTGMAPELIGNITGLQFDDHPHLRIELPSNLVAVVVPMPLEQGTGRMAVVSGAFSPVFGGDEAARLREFAISVTAALDRVQLIEQVRQANEELERRVAERTQQLEVSNRELSAANQELEAFSYTIAHDLRAPIRAIDGFSAALMEDHAAELPAGALSFMQRIIDNSQAMGKLIDTVLGFSRLGRQQLKKRRLQPETVVRTVLTAFEHEITERAVEVKVEQLPECEADPELLERVYANLIGNAIKFSAKTKKAVVDIGCLEPDGKEGPVYFVRDNGAGFDMAYADKLFLVFQRLHGQDEFPGTGAGLAIVQRIVQRHGGRVWGEGELGVGATFFFTLGGGK
jgi:signal transduction histidine kinase